MISDILVEEREQKGEGASTCEQYGKCNMMINKCQLYHCKNINMNSL